jgi:Flp pilus assembly pilin Flp
MTPRSHRIRQLLANETGSELVEWVLWVGAIVITLGAVYASVSGGVSVAVAAIFG